jgi:hypothetical protein
MLLLFTGTHCTIMCFGHTYFSAFSFFIAFELIRKWSCGKLPKKGAHKTKHGKYALRRNTRATQSTRLISEAGAAERAGSI